MKQTEATVQGWVRQARRQARLAQEELKRMRLRVTEAEAAAKHAADLLVMVEEELSA